MYLDQTVFDATCQGRMGNLPVLHLYAYASFEEKRLVLCPKAVESRQIVL